jgi:chromosome partitioning protein
MANKVAFFNGKGGCGKTTSIIHVAGVLSHRGEKVLVIDFDKQRNTTDALLMENGEDKPYTVLDFMQGKATASEVAKKAYFRSRGNANPKYFNVDVMPADVRLENERLLKNIDVQEVLNDFVNTQGYTWVLVDMPPSNKALNEICFSQIVDFVIAPFSSDVFSVSGYGDMIDTINRAREYNEGLNILGIYLSRYMENCAVDKFIKESLEKFGNMFVDVQIPLKSDIREAVMFGRPISYYKMVSPSKTAYENLVHEMESRINQTR